MAEYAAWDAAFAVADKTPAAADDDISGVAADRGTSTTQPPPQPSALLPLAATPPEPPVGMGPVPPESAAAIFKRFDWDGKGGSRRGSDIRFLSNTRTAPTSF